MMSGLSVAAIVLATEFRLFQRFLETEPLSFRQWLVCIGLALVVLVATEVRKAILRHQERTAGVPEAPGDAPPASAAVV
jgi:Ca2+-transporting ATPase